MGELSVTESAAVSRIAACLAPSVTNSIVDGVASELGFRRIDASNKAKKIQLLLAELIADGRATAERAIATLTLEAHHRTVAGTATLSVDDADAIVRDMKLLKLSPGELARPAWRHGLRPGRASPPSSATPTASTEVARPSAARPQRHEEGLLYIGQLSEPGVNPQHRGRQLELVLLEVLKREGLAPSHRIVNPGEELDLAFALDGQHYIVECKWETPPVGTPIVTAFSTKVARKAEGTFGVLVSMSAFVQNINMTAARGARLNCVGLSFREVLAVLEGRTTFGESVRSARREASTRSVFFMGG